MEWLTNHLLSVVVFAPLLGGLLLLAMPAKEERCNKIMKIYTLVVSCVVFLISLLLYTNFDSNAAGFQFTQRHEWIEAFGISYQVGIDGISMLLILLTTFLTPIVVLGSWTAVEEKVKSYLFCILFLETGMLGAFVSLDVILFYIFWEAMLIPMYLLIGVWRRQTRVYASMKFFISTLVGSLQMLVAIFYLLYQHIVQMGS